MQARSAAGDLYVQRELEAIQRKRTEGGPAVDSARCGDAGESWYGAGHRAIDVRGDTAAK
jgi:hypothetical protein